MNERLMKLDFAGIKTRHARRPKNPQAGGQHSQQQRNTRINQQAQHQVANDRDDRDPSDVSLDELVILFRVDIGASRNRPHSGLA